MILYVDFIRDHNAEIVALSTFVMAIFTVALFISTHLLWKSGEKHSERELRAYVGIESATIKHNPEKRLLYAAIRVRNAGQTPAYEFTVVSSFDFHEIPRTEFLQYGEVQQSTSTLFPGSEVDMPLIAERIVTADDLQAIKEEKFAFFFYGTIKYKDAFGKDRFTDFRFIADNDKSGKLSWRVTEKGNNSN